MRCDDLTIDDRGPAPHAALARLAATMDDIRPGQAAASVLAAWPEIAALDPAVFAALETCPQDPRHHGEGDVGRHARMVVAELVADPDWRSLEYQERAVLFWAAVLHDIGKPGTTKHEEDGTISSRGHSRRGALMARGLLRALGAPLAFRETVCAIIERHQQPFWLIERDNPERLAIETSITCPADLLLLHARADARGRIAHDREGLIERVELARLLFEEQGVLGRPYPFANAASRLEWLARPERDAAYPAHEAFRARSIVMSGLPGSGKDSWIARHASGLPVVSLDAIRIREGLPSTGAQGPLFQIAREEAREHLRAGRDFVWNATNISREIRGKTLRLLADYGAHATCVYLEPSPAELLRRNAGRAAAVPVNVIGTLVAKLEPPRPDEAHQVLWIRDA